MDTDYAWVQIALEGLPFWLTAMYDDRGRLIQIYFGPHSSVTASRFSSRQA